MTEGRSPANHPVSSFPLCSLPQVGTTLRAIRSSGEFRTSIRSTTGSESPPYLNFHLRPSCPQVLVYAPCPHVIVSTGPLEGSAFAGRDGSPSRLFADGDAHLNRLNGGLGEPALPKTSKRLTLPLINLPRPHFPLRIGFTTVRFSLLGPEFHPSGPAVKWPAENVSSVRRNT